MEDILSSIKRIIAEDSNAALASPRVKRSVGLTSMSRPEPSPEYAPEYADETDEDEVLELTDPVAVEPADEPVAAEPQPVAEAAPVAEEKPAPVSKKPAAPAEPKPTLVSPDTAEASRSSLAALSAMIVKPAEPGSDTLEGLVREMLKPMLADWLDAKLPEIVERQVAQEIRRISERG
jgi:cell pole-organizing protein PopZ